MTKITLIFFIFCSWGVAHGLEVEPPTPLKGEANRMRPQILLTVKDAGQIKQVIDNNAWFKEFGQSNVYRGLMLRINPVLSMLSGEYKETWKGRLLDYIFTGVLKGRSISFGHFATGDLATPGGTIFHGITPVEHKILKGVITALGGSVGGSSPQPVSVQHQVFATYLSNTCFVVSRDPNVVGWLKPYCNTHSKLKSAARARVSIDEALPSIWPTASRMGGLKRNVDAYFSYDGKAHRFTPKGMVIRKAKKTEFFEVTATPKGLLDTLPSDTFLAASFSIPDFGDLNKANLEKWVKNPSQAKQRKVLTVAMVPLRNRTSTVLIVPQKITDKALEDVGQLFDETSYVEVSYIKHCKNFVALSDDMAALDYIAATCTNSEPSLLNIEKKHRERLTKGQRSAALFFNLGGFAAAAMSMGRESLNVNRTELFDKEHRLMRKLPTYSFSGSLKDQSINMKASF